MGQSAQIFATAGKIVGMKGLMRGVNYSSRPLWNKRNVAKKRKTCLFWTVCS